RRDIARVDGTALRMDLLAELAREDDVLQRRELRAAQVDLALQALQFVRDVGYLRPRARNVGLRSALRRVVAEVEFAALDARHRRQALTQRIEADDMRLHV